MLRVGAGGDGDSEPPPPLQQVFREAEDMVQVGLPERQDRVLALQSTPSDQTTGKAPNVSRSHFLNV